MKELALYVDWNRPLHMVVHAWDRSAGELAQHQTAYDLELGIGNPPRGITSTAYAANRERVARAVVIVNPPAPAAPLPEIDLPGLSR